MFDPRHGVDGWVLEDMDWDPDTGISTFEYSNTLRPLCCAIIHRAQPTYEGHTGWFERQAQGVLAL